MKKMFLVLVLFASMASAAGDFNYPEFKKNAIRELENEVQFLEALRDEHPSDFNTVLGIFPVEYSDQINKFEIALHRKGVEQILSCIRLESAQHDPPAENFRTIFDKLLEVSEGEALNCFDVKYQYGAKVALSSRVPVDDLANSPSPNSFNPVVSAILNAYQSRQSLSSELWEEKVSNTVLFAAQRRPQVGVATIVDFGRLKYRYMRDGAVKPYEAYLTLTPDDRRGISMLAQCLKANAPIGLFYAYHNRREMPPDDLLVKTPCLFVGTGKAVSVKDLQENFALLGMTMQGGNAFMQTGFAHQPSFVDAILQADQPFQRREAAEAILAADEFVNIHAPPIWRAMTEANRQNFKGVGSLTAAERVFLTADLERRFLEENAKTIQWQQNIRAVNQGLSSCAMGEFVGLGISRGALYVTSTLAKGPGPLKVLGLTLLSGVLAYGYYDTYTQAKDVLTKWREMPPSDRIYDLCQVSTVMFDLGSQLRHSLKNAKQKGAATSPNDVPDVSIRDPPAGLKQTDSLVPTRTKAHVDADAAAKPFAQKVVDAVAAAKAWRDTFFKNVADAAGKITKPSEWGRYLSNRFRAKQKIDIASPAAVRAKTELDVILARTKSEDPVDAARAVAELAAKKREVTRQLFDATIADSSVLMLETPRGYRFVYVPKDPADLTVPRAVKDQMQAFQKALSDAGLDDADWKPTPKLDDGTPQYVLDSLPNYRAYLQPDVAVQQRLGLLRDVLYHVQSTSAGAHADAQSLHAFRQIKSTLESSLPPGQAREFDDIIRSILDLDTLRPREGGVEAALAARVQKIGQEGYDAGFALRAIAALDPDMPKTMDPLGNDAPFVLAAGDELGPKAKAEVDAALSKLKPGEKLDFGLLESARKYEAGMVLGLLASGRHEPGAAGKYTQAEFDYVMGRYGNVHDSRRAFFTSLNRELPGKMDAAVRKATDGRYQATDVTRVEVDATKGTDGLLGSGSQRDAYALTVTTKDGALHPMVAKVGDTHPKELEYLDAYATQKKRAPKVYESHFGENQGLVLQEPVIGGKKPTLADRLADASPDERVRLAEEAGEAAGDVMLLPVREEGGERFYAFFNDLNALNLVVRESDGRMLFVDPEPRMMVSRNLEDALLLTLVKWDWDFKGVEFTAFLRGLRKAFRTQFGDQGDELFKGLLRNAGERAKRGGYLQEGSPIRAIFDELPDIVRGRPNPPRPGDDFYGSPDSISQAFQHDLTGSGRDMNWHERIPRGVDEFLDAVGEPVDAPTLSFFDRIFALFPGTKAATVKRLLDGVDFQSLSPSQQRVFNDLLEKFRSSKNGLAEAFRLRQTTLRSLDKSRSSAQYTAWSDFGAEVLSQMIPNKPRDLDVRGRHKQLLRAAMETDVRGNNDLDGLLTRFQTSVNSEPSILSDADALKWVTSVAEEFGGPDALFKALADARRNPGVTDFTYVATTLPDGFVAYYPVLMSYEGGSYSVSPATSLHWVTYGINVGDSLSADPFSTVKSVLASGFTGGSAGTANVKLLKSSGPDYAFEGFAQSSEVAGMAGDKYALEFVAPLSGRPPRFTGEDEVIGFVPRANPDQIVKLYIKLNPNLTPVEVASRKAFYHSQLPSNVRVEFIEPSLVPVGVS